MLHQLGQPCEILWLCKDFYLNIERNREEIMASTSWATPGVEVRAADSGGAAWGGVQPPRPSDFHPLSITTA